MTTHLVLLPLDADAPPTCLQVDAGGQLLQRWQLTPQMPLAHFPVPVRTLLVVPGIDARAIWLDMPAHNPVQARAAAALLIEDHVASPRERLHVAVAPRAVSDQNNAPEARRLVVVVERDVMRLWLDRAAALGVVPDVVVPDYLMLPVPTDAGVCVAVLADGRWLVRGELSSGVPVAFSAEPELATLVIAQRTTGDHSVTRIDDARELERQFIASTFHPAIDLLQGEFATTSARREGWPAYSRAVALLAVLAFSPLLLIASQALRYEWSARQLESQAQTLLRDAVPGNGPSDDPSADTHARLLEVQSAGTFARDVGTLFTAVERQPGAHLDSLDYDSASGLRASLLHASASDLEAIRASVAEAGLSLDQTGTQDTGDGIRSEIVLGSSR